MKIVKIILLTIIAIIVLLLITFGVYGGFNKIEIVEKEMGDYKLIYQRHIGDYSKISSKMDTIYDNLKNNYKLEMGKGFGIFYDNPSKVEKSKLRSLIGCIPVNEVLDSIKISKEYAIANYPKTDCVVAEFPIKGQLSYMIGAMKVYIVMNKYLSEKQYKMAPFMEVYDETNSKIYYIFSKELDKKFYNNLLEKAEVK